MILWIYGGSLGFSWMLRSSRDKEEILGTNWGLRGFLGFCWETYGSEPKLVTKPFVYNCKASKAQTVEKRSLFLDRRFDYKPTGIEREWREKSHVKTYRAKNIL